MPSASHHDRLGRQARGALVCGLACFGLLQLGLVAAIETRFPEFRDPLYGKKLGQLAQCVNAAPRGAPLVLLLGSSRIYNGAEVGALKVQLDKTLGENVLFDSHHLLAAGAERFSRRLGRETVRLIGGEVQTAAAPGPLIR